MDWMEKSTIFLLVMRLSMPVIKKNWRVFDKKHNVLQISGLNKKMFIVFELVLLCFDGSLAIKFVFMNNQPCLVTSMLIDLNPDKLYYHPFIISMNSW